MMVSFGSSSQGGLYAKDLREKGLRAFNLRGGVLSWAHAGLKLVDGQGPTRRVHVYGSKWDLLPGGYEAIW